MTNTSITPVLVIEGALQLTLFSTSCIPVQSDLIDQCTV